MSTSTPRPYNRLLGRITEDAATAEPDADRLFIEPLSGNHPKITIQTTIEVAGYTLNVTLNDTSISDAVAILRRQGRTAPRAAQLRIHRPRQRRAASQRAPRHELVWCDFDADDQPADSRGGAIIKLASALLQDGQARDWSHALDLARQATPE